MSTIIYNVYCPVAPIQGCLSARVEYPIPAEKSLLLKHISICSIVVYVADMLSGH